MGFWRIVITIILPPLGVLLGKGFGWAFIINSEIIPRNLRAPAPTPSHLRTTVAIKGSFRGAEF